jgi:hypothetical protein
LKKLLNDPLLDKLWIVRNSIKSAYHWKRLNFDQVPAIFGNAMPKSGSHLVLQILQGIAAVAPFRYVDHKPIRTITADGRNRSQTEIFKDLWALKSGAIGWGYLTSNPEYLRYVERHPDLITFFIYRDPRDRLISSIFYAVDIHHGHVQHDYYTSISMEERIKTEILGRDVPGLEHLPNIYDHYARYTGWLECPSVLCLRFEDLIQYQQDSLEKILDHIEKHAVKLPTTREKAIAVIKKAIQPEKSPTFREGKTGKWQEYFTEEHKQLFKDVAGDLLIRLGYEEDNDW